MWVTLVFFDTQINRNMALGSQATVCKIIFVLQSIRDYHVLAEHDAFGTIETATMNTLQHRYDSIIQSAISRLKGSHFYRSSICNPLCYGHQFNGDNVDDPEYSSDDEQLVGPVLIDESELGTAITIWVQFYLQDFGPGNEIGPEKPNWQQLYGQSYPLKPDLWNVLSNWIHGHTSQPGGRGTFQFYKVMKVFILEHALSLGSRGKSPRDGWRLAAAKTMTELVIDRFIVCDAIILSLFLRRQYAIVDLDNQKARRALNGLWPSHLWPTSILTSGATRMENFLFKILKSGICDRRAQGDLFRFVSSRSLYNSVSINFQIYLNNALSYVSYLQNGGRTGQHYAELSQVMIGNIWRKVKDSLGALEWYNRNVEALLESAKLKSPWWREEPRRAVQDTKE
jgi:hypothetical protein